MGDKTNNLTIFLQEIADAIRYVKGTTDPINPQDFASLIKGLVFKSVGSILSDNTITLLSSLINNGTYTLKYEDSAGSALENFSNIATLTVNGADVSYSDFIEVNIPPYLSESIGVYNTSGERIGFIPLLEFKPSFGERLYRFGLLSDVHDYESSNAEPSDDFQGALSLFNDKEDVIMTCICGDISQNGTEAEFQLYQEDIATQSPNTPVYTTTGNHDCVQGATSIDEDLWEQYTGFPLVFEQSHTLSNGSIDHFLFLGMSAWNFTSAYTESNLTWLEGKLEDYKNERCFVFTHLFFPDRAGNLNEIYPSYNWLSGAQLTRLENMCDKYVNSIWFSGHSHWKWEMQSFQDRANIYRSYKTDGTPACGWCVHVPSCAEPRITTTGSDRVDQPLESQGAVVDVYENYVDIRGIDLKTEKYLPIATYRLDTTIFDITDNNENDDSWLPDGAIALKASHFYLSGSNEGNPTVEDDGDYLVFNFDALKNRFMLHVPDVFTSSVTDVMLYHSGYELSETVSDAALEKVGFQTTYDAGGNWNTTYSFESGSRLNYTVDDSGSVNNGVRKAECNVSSSYTGALPLTVRIYRPYITIQ